MSENAILDTIVIGVGFSGLCALIRLLQEFPQMAVEAYEKGDDIGGTWAKNTYPGSSCDIPSHVYSFSFAPDFNWSSTYGAQSEILSYIHHVADTHDCYRHINLRQKCISSRWLEDDYLWKVNFIDQKNGKEYERYSRFLITGTGFCDIPKGTEGIHGMENFAGEVFHSAKWNHEYAFENKNVLVIGNGSSANQFVPWLVEHGKIGSLVQVIRSAHWIAPKMNTSFSNDRKWVLQNVPFARKIWRYLTAAQLDLAFNIFKNSFFGVSLRRMAQSSVANYMRRTAPPEYHSILIPDFDLGAKRPVLDHGYLAALHDPKMTLVESPFISISGPSEITTGDGRVFPVDVIVLGNGFRSQELLTPMKIHGIGNSELPKIWQSEGNYASAHMGVSVSGFPNLFILTGPNTLPSGHSTLVGIESSVEYIVRLLHRLGKYPDTRVKLNVKPAAQAFYNDRIQRKLSELVYTSNVPNWYIDGSTGKNTLVWPGSQFQLWQSRCVREIRWNDFEVDTRKA